jgi:hypothetical protein
MTLGEMASLLRLEAVTTGDQTRVITGAYVSDMLSDVLGKASQGQVWLTMQGHQNVAAVASMLNLAAVVITGGRVPSPELLDRARQENVVLYLTDMPTFEASGRLFALSSRKL